MSVYSVNVYPSSTTIKTGNWYYGAYAVVNTSSNCCTDVEWYSDSPSVASVNKSYGYIYGISPGTAKIYARSTVDSNKKDYITVTVTSGTICVDSVTLNRSSISLEKGDTFTLSATVCPTNATNKTISWRSTNTSVATVSGGVVTAKARGYAYIYAEAQDGSGEYDSCYVNVTEDILVTSVTVSPSSKTMNIGASTYLYETVCPTNATNKCVKWSSNKTSVATVNPDTGLVIAQGAGTATITATAQDGSNKKGYCTITVNAPIRVTGVEVCPTSLTMNVGDIEYLCASITPSNATNQTVTWCSSNENVATVGLYTGKITAKSFGETVITATSIDGEHSDSLLLNVNGISDGELTIFSCITDSSSVGSANINGHSWLTYKNTTHSCVEILGVTLSPGREISFGAWGLPNMPRKGIWTGLEAFQVAELGKNQGRVSLTIPLNSSEFEFMKSCIHEENDYSLSSYNCAIMASLVWNAVAPMDMKLSVGLPVYTTPQVVCEAIENIAGYEVNRPIMIPNSSEIGYPSNDGFVAVGQEDWRMSYTIYEYIINLFTIL